VPIVILAPQLPTQREWSTIHAFPLVYFVIGQVMMRADMIRAGIFSCHKVVILTGGTGGGGGGGALPQQKKISPDAAPLPAEPEDTALMDADCILSMNLISLLNPKAQVVCELRNTANIRYLIKDYSVMDDYTLSPPFASGTVFINLGSSTLPILLQPVSLCNHSRTGIFRSTTRGLCWLR